jgi:hypothetical protein
MKCKDARSIRSRTHRMIGTQTVFLMARSASATSAGMLEHQPWLLTIVQRQTRRSFVLRCLRRHFYLHHRAGVAHYSYGSLPRIPGEEEP